MVNTGRSLPCMSDSGILRLAFVFFGYLAQGMPIGVFFFALPAWLAANGAEPAEIGALAAAASLPWTLKFVNGFIMDRFMYLPMGKRRAWLIGAQTIMVTGLLTLAVFNPSTDDVAVLAVAAFIINAATTFQDVAIDGLAVDLIPDEERARANGLMFGGQTIGIASGTALAGLIISKAGLSAAMIAMAFFVLVILAGIILLRERAGERLLPWTQGAPSTLNQQRRVTAWWPLIKSVLKAMWTRDSLLVCTALLGVGYTYGIFIAAGPIIATGSAGWTDAEYSSLTGTAGLIAGILGLVIFGLLVDRIGLKPAALSGYVLMAGLAIFAIAARPVWSEAWFIMAFVFVYMSVDLYLKVSVNPAGMRLCDPKVAATQFTLYMAIGNLGITIASSMIGWLDAMGGTTAMLSAMAVSALIGLGCFVMYANTSFEPDAVPMPAE